MRDDRLDTPVAKTIVIPSPLTLAGHANGRQPNAPTISMKDVLFTLRRWWWRCTLVAVPLAIVAAAMVWFTFVPMYEATSLLEIKGQPPSIIFSDSRGQSGNFSQTQLEIIRSPIILSKVITDPEVAALADKYSSASPMFWLRQGLKVNYVGQSELCQITFKSPDPKASATVANAILNAYLDLFTDSNSKRTDYVVKLLKEEADNRKPEIQRLTKNVSVLLKQNGGRNPAGVAAGNGTQMQIMLDSLRDRRIEAEVERLLLEKKLKAYEQAMEAPDALEIPAYELRQALESHPEIQALKASLTVARTKAQQNDAVRPTGVRSPSVQTAVKREQDDIKAAEDALSKATARLEPQIKEEMQAAERAKYEDKISETRAQIENQQVAEEAWLLHIENERKRSEDVAEDTLELELAQDELARAKEVVDKINDRMMVMRTEMRAPSQVDIRHMASVATDPVEATPLKKCLMAFAGAFCVPFGLAFGWERLVRRISSAEQLSSEFSLPVLGEVATLPTHWMIAGRRSNERFVRDRITFEESIESLRLGLTLAPELQNLQVMTVTSAVSQEGKTSVATALAVSVARCTHDLTLLIDADMRAPNIHEMFGIDLEPGLAEVLEGTATLDEAIVAQGLGVHVLPAGVLKNSPYVAMKDGAFTKLLEQARAKYRYIIIDAPPVLSASEALLISSSADGSLLCTMRDRSRIAQLQVACQRLTTAGARLVGSVISGVPTRDWTLKYGSYPGSYSRDRYARDHGHSMPESSTEIMVSSRDV